MRGFIATRGDEISGVCTPRSSRTTMEENFLDGNWDADLDARMETSMDVEVGSQGPVTSTPALSLETTGNGTSSDVHTESHEVEIASSSNSGDTATSTSSAPATGNWHSSFINLDIVYMQAHACHSLVAIGQHYFMNLVMYRHSSCEKDCGFTPNLHFNPVFTKFNSTEFLHTSLRTR